MKAKVEGKLPYGMDEETAALFPDSFEDSELGPIPVGWRVGTISEVGKIVTGRTPSSKNPEHFDGPVPFITIPDLGRNIWQDETERTISQAGADALKSAVIPFGFGLCFMYCYSWKCWYYYSPKYHQPTNSQYSM